MKRKSKLTYCSKESWYLLKANVQEIAQNHLGEAELKDTVSDAGSPPLKGTRIMMCVDKCYRLMIHINL